MSLRDLPTVGDAALALANSPKVAVASASGGVGMGYAAKLELINGFLGTASMAVGFLTGVVVLAVWIVKFVRYWNSTVIEPKD